MGITEQYEERNYENDLWELEARHRSSLRVERTLQLYAVFGALFGLAGLVYFFTLKIQVQLTSKEQIALLFAGVGFALSVSSYFLVYLRKQRYLQEVERGRYVSAASDFLVQWARFENAGRAKLEREKKEFHGYSVREIISGLVADGRISSSDAALLEEAIRFRNFLVHGGREVSSEHLNRMTNAIQDIANRLSEL